jgi:hypothetical protein
MNALPVADNTQTGKAHLSNRGIHVGADQPKQGLKTQMRNRTLGPQVLLLG